MPDAVFFSQLSAVLAQFGFQKVPKEEFTAFSHVQSGALLLLPREDLMPKVDPLHVAAARATVVGKGVASPAQFDRLLAQAVRLQAAPLPAGHFTLTNPGNGNTTPSGFGGGGQARKKTRATQANARPARAKGVAKITNQS